MSTPIEQNTTDLQTVLDKINELPKHETINAYIENNVLVVTKT